MMLYDRTMIDSPTKIYQNISMDMFWWVKPETHQVLRKAQRTEKDLAMAEELTKQSALTNFILYVALVTRFLAPQDRAPVR